MFTDNAKIFIQSGKGGDGHVSFRREAVTAAEAAISFLKSMTV